MSKRSSWLDDEEDYSDEDETPYWQSDISVNEDDIPKDRNMIKAEKHRKRLQKQKEEEKRAQEEAP